MVTGNGKYGIGHICLHFSFISIVPCFKAVWILEFPVWLGITVEREGKQSQKA
jgi:hypothetical protein